MTERYLTFNKKPITIDTDNKIRKRNTPKEVTIKSACFKCFKYCGFLITTGTVIFYIMLIIYAIIYFRS